MTKKRTRYLLYPAKDQSNREVLEFPSEEARSNYARNMNRSLVIPSDFPESDSQQQYTFSAGVLPEVLVTPKTQDRPKSFLDRVGQFINDEIFLNKGNIRVRNYRKAEARNPNFLGIGIWLLIQLKE